MSARLERVGAGAVADTQTFPAETPYTLSVADYADEFAQTFTPGGPSEVWVVARHPETANDMVAVVLPFDTFDQGQRAGAILDDAIARLAAIREEPVAQVDDGHEHVIVVRRFSRSAPPVRTCTLCSYTAPVEAAA